MERNRISIRTANQITVVLLALIAGFCFVNSKIQIANREEREKQDKARDAHEQMLRRQHRLAVETTAKQLRAARQLLPSVKKLIKKRSLDSPYIRGKCVVLAVEDSDLNTGLVDGLDFNCGLENSLPMDIRTVDVKEADTVVCIHWK